MVAELLIDFILAFIRILAAIILSASALYTGISMLNRLTSGIDEWKLIKKGNVAVGLFYTTAMFSLMIFVAPRISEFIVYIQDVLPIEITILNLIILFVNYVLSLILGTLIIFLTIHIIDRLTSDLDEMAELERGNVAVALIMSIVLVSVVLASSVPAESVFSIIKSLEAAL